MKKINQLEFLPKQLTFVLNKIRSNLLLFNELVPQAASHQLIYQPEKNQDWTASFWSGMLFLGKELTGSTEFDDTIESQMASFTERLNQKIALETHDIGFLYTLTAVADYKVNHHETAKYLAMKAADLLLARYSPKAEIIQAWGNLDDPDQRGRMIIDCLMNLPLLYFATNITGQEKYKKAAYAHAKQTQKYIVRANYTTFHTYYFDTETGEALYGKTQQGFSDDSYWARGQAWGIYGFTLSYLYTGDTSFLITAKHLADYFINHLPEDQICYWDLIFNDGSGEEKDSSAATITVCGLLELSRQLPISDQKNQKYQETALTIMQSLAKNYTTIKVPTSNGLLLQGVYDKNTNKGVNECVVWGDYFYMEALTRLAKSWYLYW